MKDANYLIPYLEEFIPSYVILSSDTSDFEKLIVYINEGTNCELIITCESKPAALKNPFQNIVVNKPENLKDFKKILGIIDKIESEKKIKSGNICKRYDNYRFINQQVISFYSIQGGIGKTTLAFNLAYHLTNLQEVKILIIDLNFCEGPSDLSINLNLSLTPNLSLFMEKITEGFSALSKSIVNLNGFSVDILQPPLSIHQSDKFSIDMLDQLLYLARSHYNFIIADIPFRYNNVSLEMLNLSTTAVFVLSTDISAISVADFKYSEISSSFEPNRYPNATNTMTQIPAPSAEYRENLAIFIFARPAGKEISWRIPGMRRPLKVERSPCLVKNASSLSRVSSFIKKYFPYFKMNFLPKCIAK